ncbi:hypothetical protein [Tautonia plasticadhaerens]|nr:hypothetical protein [Tautonia plasticadhaerens]
MCGSHSARFRVGMTAPTRRGSVPLAYHVPGPDGPPSAAPPPSGSEVP